MNELQKGDTVARIDGQKFPNGEYTTTIRNAIYPILSEPHFQLYGTSWTHQDGEIMWPKYTLREIKLATESDITKQHEKKKLEVANHILYLMSNHNISYKYLQKLNKETKLNEATS